MAKNGNKEISLQEFVDILHSKGYQETPVAYSYLDGCLQAVDFVKDEWFVQLHCEETDQFYQELKNLEPGTEYTVDYKNYIVTAAFIQSPICDVSDFLNGKKDGILLVDEPGEYHKHGLDEFEYCLGLQRTNLLGHELKIMQSRIDTLTWANSYLVPILEKYDYYAAFDHFFNCNEDIISDSSDPTIEFNHPNNGGIRISNDCITGKPCIVADGIDITDEVFGKDSDTVYEVLCKKVWEQHESKYGYIWKNDPKETKDTYCEVITLFDCLQVKRKTKINFEVIPDRYDYAVEEYKKMFPDNV